MQLHRTGHSLREQNLLVGELRVRSTKLPFDFCISKSAFLALQRQQRRIGEIGYSTQARGFMHLCRLEDMRDWNSGFQLLGHHRHFNGT